MENDLLLLRQIRKAQVLYRKLTKFRMDCLNGGIPTERQKKWEREMIVEIDAAIDNAYKDLYALIEDKLSDKLNEANVDGARDADEQEKECWDTVDTDGDNS